MGCAQRTVLSIGPTVFGRFWLGRAISGRAIGPPSRRSATPAGPHLSAWAERFGTVVMVPQDVIEVAGRKLAAAAKNPVKVVLFGSHARGDAGPDSDLDFLCG